MDIFSTEFLESLRSQVTSKVKNSKVLLQAIKQLTQTNQNTKKTMMKLQNEIKQLREENSMLLQIIQTNKMDLENRIEIKDKKIQKGIQIQAQLSGQNQCYRNQIQKLRQQLSIYKNKAASIKNMHESTKNIQNQDMQKSLVELVSINSEDDLNAYLYSQKETERSQKQPDPQISLEIYPETNMKTKAEKENNKNKDNVNLEKQNDIQLDKIGKYLQCQRDKNRDKQDVFYSSILYGRDDEEKGQLDQ